MPRTVMVVGSSWCSVASSLGKLPIAPPPHDRMIKIATVSPADRQRRIGVLVSQLAHLAPLLSLVCVPLLLTIDALTGRWWSAGRLVWCVPVAVVMAVVFCAQLLHSQLPCLRCSDRAPADGVRSAARVRPLLWLYHHWPLVAMVFGLGTVPFSLAPLWGWYPEVYGSIIDRSIWVVVAVVAQAVLTHRVHVSWCMYCDDEDGGDDNDGDVVSDRSLSVAARR